jgi:hypothetical protein
MTYLSLADEIEDSLSPATAVMYRRIRRGRTRTIVDLRSELATATAKLVLRAQADEFFDSHTANNVAVGCQALLRRLEAEPSPRAHEAVQAAVEYFLMERDAEPDHSIIGFDDDLEVLTATARALGWPLDPPSPG